MLPTTAALVGEREVAKFAWSSLRVFRNVEHTAKAIQDAHSIPEKGMANARKQARQIRHCLIQAEEYALAADAVTSATRPTLQYYSMMSLATAEVLFKGTGAVSIDKARQDHGHHGLTLKVASTAEGTITASGLLARPALFGGGERKGTFELWHQHSRLNPICGAVDRQVPTGAIIKMPTALLMKSGDTPPAPMSDEGVTLLQCIQHIPGLSGHVQNFNVSPLTARCHAKRRVNEAEASYVTSVIFHPASEDLLQKIYAKISSDHPDQIVQFEYPSGRRYEHTFHENNPSTFTMPNGVSIGDEVFIWPYDDDDTILNYFGWLYVTSFILGSYARYYPDKWMRDIEGASYIAVAADAFYRLAADHAPLNTLSELSRVCLVPGR